MRRKYFWFIIVLLVVFSINVTVFSAEDKYLQFYQYDSNLPLKPSELEMKAMFNFVQYKITFQSVQEEKVYALLNLPVKGNPPYPCIIVQHGYGGDKEFINLFAGLFAGKGYATIAIDAPLHGERKVKGKDIFSPDLEEDSKALTQAIFDLRRTVDYLQTREDIDTNRIGYMGMSMGAILGSIFCGVDKRIKAVVLMVGGGKWSLMLKNSQLPAAQEIRKEMIKKKLTYEDLDKTLSFVEPLNYIGFISPRPVLMLNGDKDDIVPVESSKLLYEAAKEPKKIIWYNAGHLVPPSPSLRQAFKWFEKYL